MKSKIFTLFLGILCLILIEHPAFSQTPSIVKVGCSEYRAFYLCSDKKVYAAVWNNAVNASTPQAYNIPNDVIDLAGGLYIGSAVDVNGYAYSLSNQNPTATRCVTDINGNPFTGNVACGAYFNTAITVKSDGTLWCFGGDDYDQSPTATSLPNAIQLKSPAGVKFTKVSCGDVMLALTTTGDVYQYSKGNVNPTKINLPKPASDIASGNGFQIAIIPDDITAGTNGWPYGWGYAGTYLGLTGSISAPVALKSTWGMTLPIWKITASHNIVNYLDANGQMWTMGDNAEGEVGIGSEKVNHAETFPNPYVWDWVTNGMMVSKPVHISQGITFTDIFAGGSYAFYHYAIDDDGKVYSWGRNKSLILGNNKAVNNESAFPNALDVLTPTVVTPMTQKANGFDFKPYTISPGANQTITLPTESVTMNGSAVASTSYTIASYRWTKVSGPTAFNIQDPANAKTVINGLAAGVYVFRLQMTDNNTATISGNVTITVNSSSTPANQLPIARTNGNQTITLPTAQVTLDGSTSYDPDGTIASYKWEYVSGPAGYLISNGTSAVATASGLVEGAYQFKLTVTDNAGAPVSTTVNVTVSKPANKPPVANAGAGATITLPTNSANLDGSASSDPDGTIVSYSWVLISGPAGSAITDNTADKTTVTGLVAGQYKYQLTVKDDAGAPATSTVIITVNDVANKTPIANAGADINITLPVSSANLNGSASSDPDGTIATYKWEYVSGPAGWAITNNAVAQTKATGLVQGTYQFRLTVTDNKGAPSTDVVNVYVLPAVPANVPPVADAGNNATIILPYSTLTLDGTQSYDPDGSIVTYKWTKFSGPDPVNIVNSSSSQASVPGLAAGVYVFRLTVTDNKSASSTSDVTIVIKDAATNEPPVANAGNNQAITLPDNSVRLDGGASSDPDGTIATYSWQQLSGPSASQIDNGNAAVTEVTGLEPGGYSFELTVTDNDGAISKDTTIIIVNYVTTRTNTNNHAAVELYPNPFVSSVNVKLTDGQGDGSIIIYDVNGKAVARKDFTAATSVDQQTLNLSTLQSGFYEMVILVGKNYRITRKIVKQ